MFQRENRIFKIPFTSAFLAFSLVIFLIDFGDSIMSYTTPVFLEKQFNNTFIMGLVFSFSSVVGLILDFYAGDWFKNKKFPFFIFWTVIFALIFPLALLLLPRHLLTYLFALGAWGIYYELIAFSRYHLIKSNISKDDYSKAWGISSNLGSIAYLIGPMLATFLVSKSLNLSFYTSLIFFGFSILSLLLLSTVFKFKKVETSDEMSKKRSLKEELMVWRTLFNKVWILWVFSFVIICVDAAFWSVGILFTEELKEKYSLGGFFLLAYMLPGTVMGFLMPTIAEKLGKKRTAFITGGLAGVLFFVFAFSSNIYLLFILIFLASILTSIASPAISATFEDYVKRLGLYGNDMIGLGQTSGSLAYIIAPIIFGAVASTVGSQRSFAFAGMLLTSTALASFVSAPRKIKMPQTELAEVATVAEK